MFKLYFLLILSNIIKETVVSFIALSSGFQITIKIKGNGLQKIISDYFTRYSNNSNDNHYFPNEIILNGNLVKNLSNNIQIISEKEINIINLKWETNTLCTSWLFQNCKNITEVDLSLCKGEGSIRYMFENCISLTSIYFGDFFKGVRCYWMEYIFSNCFSLLSLDLSNFDTSYITNMD